MSRIDFWLPLNKRHSATVHPTDITIGKPVAAKRSQWCSIERRFSFRLAFDQGFEFNGVFEVFTVVALAIVRTKNARLEALAILLQASRLFTCAPLSMVLFTPEFGQSTLSLYINLILDNPASVSRHWTTQLACHIFLTCVDLRAECIGRFIESLLDGCLANWLKDGVVLAWAAIASVGRAVDTGGKTFTIKF